MLSNATKIFENSVGLHCCTLLPFILISSLSLTACNLPNTFGSVNTAINTDKQTDINVQNLSSIQVDETLKKSNNEINQNNNSPKQNYINSIKQKPTRQEIEDCTVKNGKYQKVGLLQSYQCVVSYSDAGKVCQDSSDCQGECFASQRLRVGEPNQVGQCAKTSHTFGCQQRIRDGIASNILCID